MAREKQDYRDQLAILTEIFPGRATLTVSEAARVLGVDRRRVKAMIERRTDPLPAQDTSAGGTNKCYIIPIAALARFTA